jgi:bifunctional DNA-binding transcriptional regulator/antitoxin component of YhaV-PrlF toxin-antitoxin module
VTALQGKVVEGGWIIVPAAFRQSLGLEKGDTVFMELHGDELRIRPARSALRRIQAKLRSLAPPEGFVSDELIAERRAEAEGESGQARFRCLGPALPLA